MNDSTTEEGIAPRRERRTRPTARNGTPTQNSPPTPTAPAVSPMTESAIRIRKTGEVVADRIRKRIARGELPIGHQLPREEELTAAFGIARTTLREALRVLEAQGLIEIKRGRGGGGVVTMPKLDHLAEALAIVLQLQHTSLGDLDEARILIEPPLAGRLARHRSDDDLKVLWALVDEAFDAAERHDTDTFGSVAVTLHQTIIQRGGNNTMAVLGALLDDLLQKHLRRATSTSTQEDLRRAARSFRKLVRLIEAQDVDGAIAHWQCQLEVFRDRWATLQVLDVYD